jgi:hypothetical protein
MNVDPNSAAASTTDYFHAGTNSNEFYARMEALRLASGATAFAGSPAQILAIAQSYYDFMMGVSKST